MSDLIKLLAEVGIYINPEQQNNFQKYIDLILAWNKRINLISRKDESNIMENHILESLAFLLSFEMLPGAQIIDIGSGAGFPAIPISLIQRDADFLLVESKRKKVLFLKEVISQLKLENVAVIGDRAENLAQNAQDENRFDLAFSRAVASLDVVYGWVERLLKPNGSYFAWKGGAIQSEIEPLQRKNIIVDVIQMDARLVYADKDRVFVRIKRKESNYEGEF